MTEREMDRLLWRAARVGITARCAQHLDADDGVVITCLACLQRAVTRAHDEIRRVVLPSHGYGAVRD